MKDDKCYEKLEGNIIDYINNNGTIKGKIIGCNPDIGITAVAEGDPNDYLICFVVRFKHIFV